MENAKRNEPAGTGSFLENKEIGSGLHSAANSCSIAHPDKHVNPYYNIPKSEIVEAVRTLYPGFDKTLLSKCENGYRYGIQLRKDAEKLILMTFAPNAQKSRKKDFHKKTNRISARLSNDVYTALQQAIVQRGCTMQDFIEGLVLDFIKGGNTHGNTL